MKPNGTTLRRLCVCLLLGMAGATLCASERNDAADALLFADGPYVIELHAKLAWPRCAEGMQWNGKTCSGEPDLFDHAEAMALAAAREKADGVSRRLPRVAELQRLVRRSARARGLDAVLFPNAPQAWYWSATANIDTAVVNQYDYGNVARGVSEQSVNRMAFLHGWAVNLATGEARGDVLKRTKLPVRLLLVLD